MKHIHYYDSPLGRILLSSDEYGLTGLWFEGQKYYAASLTGEYVQYEDRFILSAVKWLDSYFSGEKPVSSPQLHLSGTEFRMRVWKILTEVPYGTTMTYGDISAKLTSDNTKSGLLARAVGAAVGHNPVSIIIPCHRIIGAGGKLSGYAGGIDRKKALLKLEGIK